MISPIFQMRKQSLPEVKGWAQVTQLLRGEAWIPTCVRQTTAPGSATLVHWVPQIGQTVKPLSHELAHPWRAGPLLGGWCLQLGG